jgi:hypothetical protein
MPLRRANIILEKRLKLYFLNLNLIFKKLFYYADIKNIFFKNKKILFNIFLNKKYFKL